MSDPLSICVNATFAAESLEELAEIQREMAAGPGADKVWAERLSRWAGIEEAAARQIRGLVAEIERLRKGVDAPAAGPAARAAGGEAREGG